MTPVGGSGSNLGRSLGGGAAIYEDFENVPLSPAASNSDTAPSAPRGKTGVLCHRESVAF